MNAELPVSIRWEDEQLLLLDQTRLPHEQVFEPQLTTEQLWQSIHALKVRGAPAIGIASAYGLCVALRPHLDKPVRALLELLGETADYLNSARPTAVNLAWALNRMRRVAGTGDYPDGESLYRRLVSEAEAIHAEDRAICQGIGEQGLALISEGSGVMTHCNAGALATGGMGTATAPLYLAHQAGRTFQVFAGETRPLLQGARLTSWELRKAGIDVRLFTDSMAAQLMASGEVNLVLVGCDRVVANGDVANKIGTLGLAVLARHFGIPFYVACPSSTIDLATASGAGIPIEQRHADEVRQFGSYRSTESELAVINPAFDVTPAELVTGIITEKGTVSAPYAGKLEALLKQ